MVDLMNHIPIHSLLCGTFMVKAILQNSRAIDVLCEIQTGH